MYSQAMGGVKLLVNKDSYQDALHILSDLYKGNFAINDEGEDLPNVPSSREKNSMRDYLNIFFVFAIFLTMGLALPFSSRRSKEK